MSKRNTLLIVCIATIYFDNIVKNFIEMQIDCKKNRKELDKNDSEFYLFEIWKLLSRIQHCYYAFLRLPIFKREKVQSKYHTACY